MSLEAARLVAQLALGVVFLAAAAGKLRRPAVFLEGVVDYEILPRPLAYAFGVVVIPVEAFLAVSHLTGWALGLAMPLALILLLSFAAAVGINLRRDRDLLCHCFDGVHGERISRRSLIQLLLLVAAEAFVLGDLAWPDLNRTVYQGQVATLPELALALPWIVFVLVAASWLLRVDDVVTLFRTHRCSSCTASQSKT